MKKIGLFFGSFDPIHIGHMTVANEALNQTDLDAVAFVISPQNPFKSDKILSPFIDRWLMVSKAINGNDRLLLSDIENQLPNPSYTCRTLHKLESDYRYKDDSYEFSLIMGMDNLINIHKWKNPNYILKHEIIVYPRRDLDIIPIELQNKKTNIQFLKCKQFNISSTVIREFIRHNEDVSHVLHPDVYNYIKHRNLYK